MPEGLFTPTVSDTVETGMLQPTGTPRSTLTLVLLIGGLALFAILVWRSGPDLIRNLLLKVGWALPFVFLPHALVTAFEPPDGGLLFLRMGVRLR